MISLDKKILDKDSTVARRMIEYGKTNELFILIPDGEKLSFDLSPTVHIQSAGGLKFLQFFSLINLGGKILKNFNIEEISTQDPFFTGLIGVFLKLLSTSKLEVQIHGDFFSSQYYRRSGLNNLIRYWLAKAFVLRYADRLRVVGGRIQESLIRLGIDKNKIYIKPIAIVSDYINNYQPKFNLRDKYPGYKKIFICLGRLDQVKNIIWLVNIFAKIVQKNSEYLLLIVGNGPEEGKIRARIRVLGLEKNVKMENWTDDPVSDVKTSSCLLFPSLSEGCGLVAMEAYAVGTPIIMSNVGVANYELKPSDKVKILPINDKEKWIEAILKS